VKQINAKFCAESCAYTYYEAWVYYVTAENGWLDASLAAFQYENKGAVIPLHHVVMPQDVLVPPNPPEGQICLD
jgi:hypothetical protein